jgi:hypothetical protein
MHGKYSEDESKLQHKKTKFYEHESSVARFPTCSIPQIKGNAEKCPV